MSLSLFYRFGYNGDNYLTENRIFSTPSVVVANGATPMYNFA